MADSLRIDPFRSAVWRGRVSALAALCLLPMLAGCAPELNWRKVQPEQAHGLSALFPCKPEHFARQVPWPGVPAGVSMRLLACEAQGRHWSLSYVTLPEVGLVEPALRQWPEMMLANLRQASSSQGQVSAADLGPVSVPRMTPSAHARAWVFEGTRPDAQGRAATVSVRTWHFFHGMTVFQASVSGASAPADPQSSEDVAQAFFAAFQFPG